MRCIILRLGSEERRIASGAAYVKRPGERIVGTADCDGSDVTNTRDEVTSLIMELDNEIGEGAGDWIKRFVSPVARLLNKGQCSGCETRRVVTNAYANLKAKHGQLEALKIIKALWSLSFSATDEDVLAKLREYL